MDRTLPMTRGRLRVQTLGPSRTVDVFAETVGALEQLEAGVPPQ